MCVIKEFFVREKNPSKAPPHKKNKRRAREKKWIDFGVYERIFDYLSLLSTKSYTDFST